MIDPNIPAGPAESYARIVGRPLAVLGLLAALAAWHARTTAPVEMPPAAAPRPTPTPAPAVAAVAPEPEPEPELEPEPPPTPPAPAPKLDEAAVARAEGSLDAASRERAHAEARLADAERSLQVATVQAAQDLAASKAIGSRVHDPSARIAAASTRGGFLKGERDRLRRELAALERVPVAKAQAIMAKSAVAKPTDGAEFHFEVRRNRVAFIDLDRLTDLVKADARSKLRGGIPRGRVGGTVGPAGSFSLRYEMGRTVPDALAEMLDAREASYNLLGWEVVPGGPNRGEPLEATRSPSSSYARAVHRLVPGRDTVTMWIYPDGFALYRQLRDELHARGFLVAARPLPEGVTIKGSPSGSLSAGQ